jgi:hypothetical protein
LPVIGVAAAEEDAVTPEAIDDVVVQEVNKVYVALSPADNA